MGTKVESPPSNAPSTPPSTSLFLSVMLIATSLPPAETQIITVDKEYRNERRHKSLIQMGKK
jgi:hypothetical protein